MYDTIDKKLLKKFQIIKKIGQGAYGQVWKVKNKKTGGVFALKKIYDAFRNESDSQKTYREIKYLQKFDHPSIIKLQKFYKSSNEKQVYLCLQYMEADLSIALKNSVLKQIHKHYIFYQMANVLYYLHSADLIHRDIKPSNILINQTCEIKLCDFGLIRSLHKENKEELVMTQNVATRWYRAPQILLCSKIYGKSVDIWSLGCVLAEMVIQRPLFQGTSSLSQLQKIFEVTGKPTEDDLVGIKNQAAKRVVRVIQVKQKKSLKSILNTDDNNLLDLLQKIFQINPEKRPSSEQILSHPFIIRFRGRLQEKKALFPIKILYQSRLLTVEDYKTLLVDQDDEQTQVKYKNSQDIAFDEPKHIIYKTVPSEINRNSFLCHLPSDKIERKSPLHCSNLNNNHLSPKIKQQFTPIREIIKEEDAKKRQTSPSFLKKRKKQGQSITFTPEKIQSNSKMKMKKIQTFPLRSSPAKQSKTPLKGSENRSIDIKMRAKAHQTTKNPQKIKEDHVQNNKIETSLTKQKTRFPINKTTLPQFNTKISENQKGPLKEGDINPQKVPNKLMLQGQVKNIYNITQKKLKILDIDRLKGPVMNKSVSPMNNRQNEPTQLIQVMSQKALVFKQVPKSGIDFDRRRHNHFLPEQIVHMRK